MIEYSNKTNIISRVISQHKKNSPSHRTVSIWDVISQKKTIQCKYQWSRGGDDGALIGDEYVIKLGGYDSSAQTYDKKAKELGLITPDSQIITYKSSLWEKTVKTALKDVNYRWRNGEKIGEINKALLMEKVYGKELTDISLREIPKDRNIRKIFSDIGKILVLDLYMRNYDRFDLKKYKDKLGESKYDDIGDENWQPWSMNEENLLIDIDKGKAIPIDSGSYFRGIIKKEYQKKVISLLERKEEIIDDILKNEFFMKLFTIMDKKGKEIILFSKKEIARKNLQIGMDTTIKRLFNQFNQSNKLKKKQTKKQSWFKKKNN